MAGGPFGWSGGGGRLAVRRGRLAGGPRDWSGGVQLTQQGVGGGLQLGAVLTQSAVGRVPPLLPAAAVRRGVGDGRRQGRGEAAARLQQLTDGVQSGTCREGPARQSQGERCLVIVIEIQSYDRVSVIVDWWSPDALERLLSVIPNELNISPSSPPPAMTICQKYIFPPKKTTQ